MSLSSNLNPDVVKTALDDVFYQTFNGTSHPNHSDATDEGVFHQSTVSNAAVIWEEFKGVGNWEVRAEEADVPAGNPRVDNKKTFSVINYSKSVDITKNLFDDDMHSVIDNTIMSFARRAKTTRDQTAFGIYRGAFATTTTAEGSYLVSDTHTNLNGDTIDNKLTAVLSPTSLEDAIVALGEMKAQDGVIEGHIPSCLLVPMKLYKEAIEITESRLESDTANNAVNWSTKYGIRIATSPYLGAAAGGSDTAWFLLAEGHSVYRFVRQGVETSLVDWKFQRNNNYIYKGEYREVYGAMSYAGIVGSLGTT